MTFDTKSELTAFGASGDDTQLLDQESYKVVDYLDLIWRLPESANGSEAPRPTAVVEVDGRPILYVLRADALSQNPNIGERSLIKLRNVLACRGDGAYIGVLRPGHLTVYRPGFVSDLSGKVDFPATTHESRFLLRDLSMGTAPKTLQQQADDKALHDLLKDLIGGVSKDLRRTRALRADDSSVLSLVGRALFARFLIDRNILTSQTLQEVFDLAGSPVCFADPVAAASTCRWMDDTFNGDLLPLPSKDYRAYFASLLTKDRMVFNALSKIVERTEYSGQHVFDWGSLNFAHVPVGVLSEVYEEYANEFFPEYAKKESIRYTPRHIAEFMIDQAFDGIREEDRHKVRILDPSAGGGVFLVLALRRLFVEQWKKSGRRPNSDDLRKILLEQICGFDINGHALKLAAFSLHLTTIELEPRPTSPQDLRFVKLENTRLLSARKPKEGFPSYPVLGSLGDAIRPEHDGQYDIVIGNPPWTAWKGKMSAEMNAHAQTMIRKIAASRLPVAEKKLAEAYRNPDNVPDLPFVWRAMEWVRSDGIIAFALHGRLLFKRATVGADARDLLFRCLRITGILNGGGLDSSIWPRMNQPFCLLFARNTVPTPEDAFQFVSAERDERLNSFGYMRIDPDAAEPVQREVLIKKPYLLKTLFRGSALDAELIERLNGLVDSESAIRLGKYWVRRAGLDCGVGYQVAGQGQSAAMIRRLKAKDLPSENDIGHLIDARRLNDFSYNKLHRPRRPDIYKPPLVIISKAPGETAQTIRARIALGQTAIAYNESYYGLSAYGHPHAADMARYLFLLANSDLFIYHALMSSAKFGVERRVVYGEDIKDFPIFQLETLSGKDRIALSAMVEGFRTDAVSALRRVNQWVFKLYGLGESDQQLVRDTISVQMPYEETQQRAEAPPTKSEIERFRRALEKHLNPYFALTGETIAVGLVDMPSNAWKFVSITTSQSQSMGISVDTLIKVVEALSDHYGCSLLVIELGTGRLLLGIMAQYRYWTPTRARLGALHILRKFSYLFPVPTGG